MKKGYLLIALLLVATFSFAQVSVTFQVDMSKQTVSSNGVHVAGSFQDEAGFAGDWDPSTAALTDGDGDGVYTLTVTLPADSTFQYKFVNGNAWGGDEGIPSACNVGGNRELKVPSSGPYSIPTVCFASCDACPTAVDTIAFTLRVDMSQQTVSANGVHVAGGFGAGGYANWDPAGIALTDGDADNVYEVTLNLPEGEYPFKFVNGNAWGGDEGIPSECATGGNRSVKLLGDGDDQSESGFTYSFIAAYGMCPPSDSVDVTFMVDMNNIDNISVNGIHMAGAFGSAGQPNWDPAGIMLTDANSDAVFEVTLRLPAGKYEHKFLNGNDWGGGESVPPACNVNGNRQYVAMGNGDAWNDILTDQVKVCYGECSETCPTKLPPINVTFRVDMSNEIVDANGVFIAGSFPGAIWDKDSFLMTDDNNDDIFEYTFVDLDVDDYQYKFYNGICSDDKCAEDHDFKTDGCGVDNGVGGWNRYVDLSGTLNDTAIVTFVFNSCEESSSSVHHLGSKVFKVFPNPANDMVTVRYKGYGTAYTVSMVDLNGRSVMNVSSRDQEIGLNVQSLNPGIYLMVITDDTGETTYEKLIVQ
ncbi:MAG: T9SS type A sorting domain-containing protein [Bacteroidetes bacterium]|nr:T9SS type A sorting domain-containing protein [Bacteroidota bacterium]